MFDKKIKLLLLFFILSISLSACSLPFKKDKSLTNEQELNSGEENSSEEDEPVKRTGKMKKFKDKSSLEAFLLSNSSDVSLASVDNKSPVVDLSYFSEGSLDSLKGPDLLNYENNFAFTLVKDRLNVLRLGEEENTILSEISFDSRPSGLILADKSLIVYGQNENLSKLEDSPFYFVQVFNLDEPAAPRLINNYSFEGQVRNLFAKDGYFYLITETESKQDFSQKKLARVFKDNALLSSNCDGVGACFSPEVFYFDLDYKQLRFLNVNVLDLTNDFSSVEGSVYLLNEDHKAFVSNSSVFISFFKSVKEGDLNFEAKRELVYEKLSEDDKSKIDELDISSEFILNKAEKQKRVEFVLDSFIESLNDEEKLALNLEISVFVGKTKSKLAISDKNKIHKIRLKDGKVEYYAVGEVKGEIFNNYSVLEEGNHIYLGTSNGDRLNSGNELRYYASIYVLNSSMKVLGKLENLASKEDLYGVRFVGDRAFLVSSEEEGSLFVVSLGDKLKPEFAGVVKLPGKTIQLFPVDKNANKLISLAYYNEIDSDKSRIKLSLLDISNLKEPKELDSYLLGEFSAASLVFSDKKSFSYSPSSSLIMVPVSLEEDNRLYFSGIFVFKVLESSLEMKGQIDHSVGGFYNYPDNFAGFSYLDNSVKRSFVSNNTIYSYSNKFLISANIDNLDTVTELSLMIHNDDALVSALSDNIEEDYLLDYPLPENEEAVYQEDYQEDLQAEEERGVTVNEPEEEPALDESFANDSEEDVV